MRMGMEVFLNCTWALVALLLIEMRRRTETRTGAHRRNSLVALAMLLVILFPVISVTDDLWSIQYPAETDTALRRNHLDSGSYNALTAIALPAPEFQADIEFSWIGSIVTHRSTPRPDNPLDSAIRNRPPPSA